MSLYKINGKIKNKRKEKNRDKIKALQLNELL